MKIRSLAIVMLVNFVLFSCTTQQYKKEDLKTTLDSVSYAVGQDIAIKIRANIPEIDKQLVMQGIENGLDSTNLLIEPTKIDSVLMAYFNKKRMEEMLQEQKEQEEKLAKEFGQIKEEGEKFLEENKNKSNVIVTESGLQYIVLKEGTGAKPAPISKVKVNYHGTLIDGTVFDSSIEKGQPAEFFVNRVIKGWTEGLQLMSVGSKYKFFIPQELAYGAYPRRDGKIKPFSMLIFEVELLDIVN